ncbi:hypothetical protein Poly51_20940 [Rubripirellula tenax]|uniref:Uncharacterized protein n=2 Tax=Rubripirellula tenax TaxID=2528015 RepID=A0A5C6FGU4_9BACT|nr:hypothetical protein Poly51_20940 [Rubripirellula tenax]
MRLISFTPLGPAFLGLAIAIGLLSHCKTQAQDPLSLGQETDLLSEMLGYGADPAKDTSPDSDESTDALLGNGKDNESEGAESAKEFAEKDESDLEFDGEPASDASAKKGGQKTDVDRLSRLRKPLHQIRITPPGSSGREPSDRADELTLVTDGASTLVTAMGFPVFRPDRNPECFQHRPLYFEQPNLERCGKNCGYFQNGVSAFRFVANTMKLPYHMAQQRPACLVSSGGDCQTCQSYPVKLNPLPLDRHAVWVELAAVSAVSLLLL